MIHFIVTRKDTILLSFYQNTFLHDDHFANVEGDLQFSYLSPVDTSVDNTHYKILVISDYRTVGSSRPEAEIFIKLAERGHTVHILSHHEATFYNARFRSFGIEVFEQHPTRKISRSFIAFLRKLMRQNQYDMVHAYNSKGLTNAVWALRGFSAKLIAYRGYAGQTDWYDPMMYLKYFHPRVDHIICVSQDIKNILAKNMIGRASKLTNIPKGHDPLWYVDIVPEERESLGFREEDILICFLANVRPFKGLTYLLQATHLLPPTLPIQFLFIGKGYEQPAIQNEMDASPLRDRLHVLGFKSNALPILAACDSLVLASTHGEGLSKSVVETMCLGIAPIITDISENKGLLIDGESGWTVPSKDPAALAKAITDMATNPDERKRRGANAREHMHRHFHIDQTVDAYVELYERLKK